MESKLKLYSLGIVVEDKPEGNNIILVSPIEHLNLQGNKLIKDNGEIHNNSLPDITGTINKVEVKSSSYIRASWIPYGQSNRITAPDVIKNETVCIFKYADVDEYYWTTIFNEPELRRLENVVYMYSNMRSGMKAFDKSSSYWFNVDTKNKKVRLHTSNNDGEYTTYDITIDTKIGSLSIIDGKKNYINLDSKSDTLLVKTNTNVNVTAGKNVTIKAPKIVLDGDVSVTGSLSTNGTTSSNGSMDTNGHVSVKGDVNVVGVVNAKNV